MKISSVLQNAARARLNAWMAQRLPRNDTLVLTQRNLYVLPTGVSLFLALTLLVLLVASINYQANLGFLLSFMLAASAFVSVLVAHGNLRGLHARLQVPEPVFAGQPLTLRAQLHHSGRGTRHSIEWLAQQPSASFTAQGQADGATMADIPPGENTALRLGLAALPRGLHPCPTLVLQTHYPIGTFRVWGLWRPASTLVVYPSPETNAPPLPRTHAPGMAGAAATRTQSLELDGFRTYQRGDPLKTILWKKAATAMVTGTGDWVRRDQQDLHETELWLDHSHTGLSHPEAILSRLCAWVLEADQAQVRYGLRLPQREVPIGSGTAHLHQCLRTLAESTP